MKKDKQFVDDMDMIMVMFGIDEIQAECLLDEAARKYGAEVVGDYLVNNGMEWRN